MPAISIQYNPAVWHAPPRVPAEASDSGAQCADDRFQGFHMVLIHIQLQQAYGTIKRVEDGRDEVNRNRVNQASTATATARN